VVTLDTFRALHEHAHKPAAYCPTYDRWAVLDLERLIAEGRGDYRFVGRKPRCSCILTPREHEASAAAELDNQSHQQAHCQQSDRPQAKI
jgi:hypothetical protein